MRTLQQRLSYEHLELIPQSQSPRSHSLGRVAHSIRTYVERGLTRLFMGAQEPHIWAHTDKRGNQSWYVRDPKTQYVTRLNSEDEVRIWLDDRYYHDTANGVR
ncbi:MAG: hypothetical protein VKL39_12930 [Leptolyngbyaceae bacterium]|nr:hypothetical protein [Leptolyngbyaceae bacterium]